MNSTSNRQASTPDRAQAAILDLIAQHLQEARTHELDHQALIAEPLPPDHDRLYLDPLRPAHHPEGRKSRDLLG